MGALANLNRTGEVTKKAEVVPANFASQAVALRAQTVNPHKDLPVPRRELQRERLAFCREVFGLIRRGSTQSEAVAAAATKADRFPKLAHGGKKGRSALTLYNYRSWMKKLGKNAAGKPDWNNGDKLADRYGTTVREAKGDPRFWQVFQGFYLNENRLSLPEAYRCACKVCREAGIADVPEEHQVRYWEKTHAPTSAVLAARYGMTWAENHLMSYIRRDWSGVAVNDVWFGDHHVLDAPCKIWDEEKQAWKATRPWLTAWLDARSLYFVGVCVRAESPDSVAIQIALQNGSRSAGNQLPAWVYQDNGADYLAKGLGKPFVPKGTEYEHSVLIELGVKPIQAIPYRARAKTVERIFKEVCMRFSKRWAGYLGSRAGDRPEVAAYFWEHPEHLPTLQEISEQLMAFLDEEYHTKPQKDGKILDGKSPAEAWGARDLAATISDRDLWFAMLRPYVGNCPKVARGAAVSVDGKEYRNQALWPHFGRRIMIKRDVVNGAGAPHAFTLDGKYICALEAIGGVAAIATTAEDRAKIGVEMKRQRHELKAAFGAADELSGGMRRLAAQELLTLTPGEPVEIVQAESRKSVKGGTHDFRLHLVKPAEAAPDLAPAPAAPPIPEGHEADEPSRGEQQAARREQELLAMHEAVLGRADRPEETERLTPADFTPAFGGKDNDETENEEEFTWRN
jgi:hypothetical protein